MLPAVFPSGRYASSVFLVDPMRSPEISGFWIGGGTEPCCPGLSPVSHLLHHQAAAVSTSANNRLDYVCTLVKDVPRPQCGH